MAVQFLQGIDVEGSLDLQSLTANTTSTVALVMNGNTVEKRTLGSNAFNSTTFSTFSGSYADLTNVPTTFAPSSHNHAASEITSGTLATARLPEFIENKYTYQKHSSTGVFMPMVKGGLLTQTASQATGRLRIKLPHYRAAIMQAFTIDIYEYNTDRMQSILVGGYSYNNTDATWYNTTAIALMDSDNRDLNVRFGSDETNDFQCVSVGETNTTWTYPQVVIRDYMGGHDAQTSEVLGEFEIEFVTSDSATYDVTHQNNQPYSHWDRIEGKPTTFTPSAHNQAWSTITNTPTTISGYGITDAFDGAYSSLTGTPTLFSGSYADLTNVPTSFTPSQHTHAASDVTSGTFATARIPNLAASKITSGTFATARIPDLSASKITSGTLNNSRLPTSISVNVVSASDEMFIDGEDVMTELTADNRYVNLTGDTMTGKLTVSASITDGVMLNLHNTSNASGASIQFSDQSNGDQKGYITFKHSDSQSQGGVASFHLTSNQGADAPILVVGDTTNASRIVVKSAGSTSEVDYGFIDDANTGMYRVGADSVGLVAGGSRKLLINSSGATINNGSLVVNDGNITLNGTGRIQGIDTVSASTDAANKEYVDNHTSHPNISSASSSNNSGNTFIQDITLDSNGHVTGLETGSASGFLTSESDTLASVTGRGASTSTTVSLAGGVNIVANPLRFQRSSSGQTGQDDNVSVTVDDSNIYFTHNNDDDGDASGFNFRYSTGGTTANLLNFSASSLTYKGNTIWHSGNSHNHDDRYYTESESDTRYFRRNAANDVDVRMSAGHGRGVRFWDSDSYKIYMSSVSQGSPIGGSVAGTATSDYNMYFKMSGGTNRGFVFKNSGTNVAQIDGNGHITTTGHFYGRSVNGSYSNIYRMGGIYFTWDSDSYGTNTHHSIRSTYGDSYGDDLTINSYHHLRINIDSNNNQTDERFEIGQNTTGTGNVRFRVLGSGTVYASSDIVAYYNFSDQRLKTDVKPTTDNLEKILKLEPIEYRWKDGGREGKKEIGLIAQEVEKIVPEVVRENKRLSDDDETLYKQVDYEHLVSTLIGAVQEQQKQIDDLKSELANVKHVMCKCK